MKTMSPRICSFCGTEMREIEQSGYRVDVCPVCSLGEGDRGDELPRELFLILTIGLCIAFALGIILLAGS